MLQDISAKLISLPFLVPVNSQAAEFCRAHGKKCVTALNLT